MKLHAVAVVLVAASCRREEHRASVTLTTPAASTSITPVASASSSADAGVKRCLPVVAAECHCTYSCGIGTETAPGEWTVTHPIWAPSTLKAKVAPYCVAGDCTDAFHAEIVCSAICMPKPADHGCHFEADRCVTSTKP